jgi:hypothetical protein
MLTSQLAGAMWHSQAVLFRRNSAADLSGPVPAVEKTVQKVNRRAESQTGQHPFLAISSSLCLQNSTSERPRLPGDKARHWRIQHFRLTGMGWNCTAGAETLNHWRVPDVGRLSSWSGQHFKTVRRRRRFR